MGIISQISDYVASRKVIVDGRRGFLKAILGTVAVIAGRNLPAQVDSPPSEIAEPVMAASSSTNLQKLDNFGIENSTILFDSTYPEAQDWTQLYAKTTSHNHSIKTYRYSDDQGVIWTSFRPLAEGRNDFRKCLKEWPR